MKIKFHMPVTLRSKRQAGESPGHDSIAKRARKPNTNSLEHFSLGQAPLRVDKRKKKKESKQVDENNYTPTPKGKGKARKDVIELSSTIGSAPPSSPPSLHGTPIASRPKKPPFDPNIR